MVNQAASRPAASARIVVIHVNERPVTVPHRLTGLEIKQAAIDQGVPIQLDFVFSQELNDRRTKIIGDTDTVSVNEHSRFVAVAPETGRPADRRRVSAEEDCPSLMHATRCPVHPDREGVESGQSTEPDDRGRAGELRSS